MSSAPIGPKTFDLLLDRLAHLLTGRVEAQAGAKPGLLEGINYNLPMRVIDYFTETYQDIEEALNMKGVDAREAGLPRFRALAEHVADLECLDRGLGTLTRCIARSSPLAAEVKARREENAAALRSARTELGVIRVLITDRFTGRNPTP